MTSITFLVIIAPLVALLVVGTEDMGSGHVALARHHDNTNVFENSNMNIQTDTNQGQACETAGGTSPISGSCTASSSNSISQGPVPSPPAPTSPCTPTMHPTVLTLTVSPPTVLHGTLAVELRGTLTDTCTGSGLGIATITFTVAGTSFPLTPVLPFDFFVRAPTVPGTYTVQAHFAGQGIFGPSNSPTETFTVH